MDDAVRQPALAPLVLGAMTVGMAAADGTEVSVTTERNRVTGAYSVEYRLAEAQIGRREFLLDERNRRISQLSFTLEKYERRRGYDNMAALHRQMLDNLAGTAVTLTATVPPEDAVVWVRHYDWAPAQLELNAWQVSRAIDAVQTAARSQTVWDASGLGDRVRAIGVSDGPSGRTGWHDLIERCSPAELYDGLDALQPNLGGVVFANIAAWHAQRVLS